MTLIFILITLAIDFISENLERYRKFDWFISLYNLLDRRFINNKYWDGNLGLLGLLFLPIFILTVVVTILNYFSWFAEAIIILFVLLYCMGPKKILNRLDNYIIMTEKDEDVSGLTQELVNKRITNNTDNNEIAIIKSVFVETHKQIFAVIFWYLVLGIIGALLYRLVEKLHDELEDVSSDFSDSVLTLLNILEWPSTRVFAIGLALAGNLVSAIAELKKSDIFSLETNNVLLTAIGISALQYSPESDSSTDQKLYWLNQFKFLVIRTLIIWLAIIGIIIFSGIN